MLETTECLILMLLGITLVVILKRKKKGLPPGPPRWPLIGNLLDMKEYPHLKMTEWAKNYKEMYTIQLGTNMVVVLNDLKLIKEVLSDPNFSIRPDSDLQEMFSGGKYGIIFTNHQQWEEQRRWASRKLREYGLGKNSLEGIIYDEVCEIVTYLKDNTGKPLNIKHRFNVAVLNSMWTILNGERMSQNDPRILQVLKDFHAVPEAINESGLMFAPWLKYVFPKSFKIVEKAADEFMKYSRNAVAKHFVTYKEGEIRDFIDSYIVEIRNTTNKSSSFYGENGRKNLEGIVSDFIQAGSETSSNTINWAICYLAYWKDIQKKLQDELDSVVGTRAVTLSDKPNLPYTEAVILETMRHSSIIAAGVQHGTAQDKQVRGYLIPKGTWIFTNIYYVHHNPAIWGDPNNFRPERFLSPDGKKVIKHEALIPFQIGKRQCIGELLARDTLFLFISTIFQKFKITMVDEEEPSPENGIFLFPKPYYLSFNLREGHN